MMFNEMYERKNVFYEFQFNSKLEDMIFLLQRTSIHVFSTKKSEQ